MKTETDIIEKIRKFVEEECKKQNNNYSEAYEFHFIPVHRYAKELAEKLNADIEIVELASWLHDMGSIIYERKDHHITGAEIAEEKLKEFGYSQENIEKVKHCILNHRGSKKNDRKTVEAQILADADSMEHFDNITGIFKAAFVDENQTQKQAKETTKQKIINSWNKLSPSAKEIIEPKYKAAILLLT